MRKFIDMTGVQEKGWLVIGRGEPHGKNLSNSIFWDCKCLKCGKIKTFNGSDIRRHKIGECKCEKQKKRENEKQFQLKKEKIKRENKIKRKKIEGKRIGTVIDETGNIYEHLTVISFSHTHNGQAYWKCLCDCGKETIVRGNSLRQGEVKSCGHLTSYKEEQISKILDENKIKYKEQYTFPDLKDKNNLRFDFACFFEDKLIGLIEYNGEQHYDKDNYFSHNGLLQKHDEMKIKYCQEKNIPLLILNKNNRIEEVLDWFLSIVNRA